jgi:SAM-dependent methyltransferase
MLRKLLYNLKHGTEHLNYGRDIVATWAKEYIDQDHLRVRILDLGIGNGTDVLNIKDRSNDVKVQIFGIDGYEPNVLKLQSTGLKVTLLDIEKDILPFDDGFFDIVIANQILEHTKEIFWLTSEISRVIKKDGILIIGVPNLASFHNRIALLFGQHPTSIELLSAHVRGFTKPAFKRFINCEGYFKL